MKIRLLCVGKLKDKYFIDAVKEYEKRLGAYAKVEILEIEDEQIPQNSNENVDELIKEKEAAKLLKLIKEKDYVICLNLNQKQYDSVEFAQEINKLSVSGVSTIDFVIGGSLGLGKSILSRSNSQICLSKMTFTHQMTRVIILEQVYRAYKILNNETYHK